MSKIYFNEIFIRHYAYKIIIIITPEGEKFEIFYLLNDVLNFEKYIFTSEFPLQLSV